MVIQHSADQDVRVGLRKDGLLGVRNNVEVKSKAEEVGVVWRVEKGGANEMIKGSSNRVA